MIWILNKGVIYLILSVTFIIRSVKTIDLSIDILKTFGFNWKNLSLRGSAS